MPAFYYRSKDYQNGWNPWIPCDMESYSGKWGDLLGNTLCPALGFQFKAGDSYRRVSGFYVTPTPNGGFVTNPYPVDLQLIPGDTAEYTVAEINPSTNLTGLYLVIQSIPSESDCSQDSDCGPCEK